MGTRTSQAKEVRPAKKVGWYSALWALWISLALALGIWWTWLIDHQAAHIARLERELGITRGIDLVRSERMIFWEFTTFVVLLVGLALWLVSLTVREWRRSRAMRSFFASVTHELKTPLTSIRLQAETLAEKSDASAGREELKRLLEDTTRLENEVERMLELARVEGGGSLVRETVELGPVLDRLSRRFEVSGTTQITVDSTLRSYEVDGDRLALQMIFKNLIENSIRHGGRSPIQIHVSGRELQNGLEVTVKDDGSGFSGNRHDLGKLFYKGEHSRGSGVGLYLVRALMQRMGGVAEFPPHVGFLSRLVFPRGVSGGVRHG